MRKNQQTSRFAVLAMVLQLSACDIPGSNPIRVSSITLDKPKWELNVGVSESLVVTIVPANATDKIVIWTSSDDSVVKVSASGVVTPLAIGSANITATTRDGGLASTCLVSVRLLPLVSVPGGIFQRDSLVDNTVYISTFHLGKYPVTRKQYLVILGVDPSDPNVSSGTDDPVQSTNWYQAIAFCNKLSLLEGLTPVYSIAGISDWAALAYTSIPTGGNNDWNNVSATWTNDGYRLPTGLEYQWASMGATKDGIAGDLVDGINVGGYLKVYAGSVEGGGGRTDIDQYVWYKGNAQGTTHPVGQKLANELGIYDLTGNVTEWVWDWEADIPAGALSDYRGATSGTKRLLVGGDWSRVATSFPVIAHNVPERLFLIYGFRVARL